MQLRVPALAGRIIGFDGDAILLRGEESRFCWYSGYWVLGSIIPVWIPCRDLVSGILFHGHCNPCPWIK